MSGVVQLLVSLLTVSRVAPASSTSMDEGDRAAAAQAALVAASGHRRAAN